MDGPLGPAPPSQDPLITPQMALRAYACGIFPMSESADDASIKWYEARARGVIPLDAAFHLPRRLARSLRQLRFDLRCDTAFSQVVAACAAPRPDSTGTWISQPLQRLYRQLHAAGFAHSVECWQGGDLVGGLFGIALRGAFFGESMFHHKRDASKVALVDLVARLRLGGFSLLDAQFHTQHLGQFGCIEIDRDAYHQRLEQALTLEARFPVHDLSQSEPPCLLSPS
ncbi:MAG: leucyl/phenylalanyl-tRNA--protein transferase [Alphaproteobacteria bacterium]|nr:MAG: leucyl/phenylalanyl-tRNA--protein transferase [Alphaproteobacteria bacterium]